MARSRWNRTGLAAVLAGVVLAGCGVVPGVGERDPGGEPGIGQGFGEPEVVAGGLEAPWGLAFLPDGGALLALAEQQGWALVVLDLGLDLTTPNGKFVAQIMSSVAELDRNLISERTRAALAAKRAQGHRLGGPIRLPHHVRESIRCARADGATLAAIAGRLNRDAIPTAQGGRRWYASTVAAVLRSIELDGCSNAIS